MSHTTELKNTDVAVKDRTAPEAGSGQLPINQRSKKRDDTSGRVGRSFVKEPGPARFQLRHWILAFSFILLVLAPAALGIFYLYTRAADQYHSTVGFSVHSEDRGSPIDMLGVISTGSNSSGASDSDILYEFIRSQQMVEEVGQQVDLIEIFNKPQEDPIFVLGDAPTIEKLHSYWERMVSVSYDSATNIIEVEARAFNPDDAYAIASAVVQRSTELINDLSNEAKQDAIRFAGQDLQEAETRLRDIRRQIRDFRDSEQQIDPTADIEQLMGVVLALESELANALISRDILTKQVTSDDSRVLSLDRRIEAIRRRIVDERAKIGIGATAQTNSIETGQGLAGAVGDYEELVMDREFAQEAYIAVLAAYTDARAEARRKHRYLAAHVGPTVAQEALFPRRWLMSLTIVFSLVVAWLVMVLIIFNVRDNR